jgi:L-asparaginase/Glu-tRNA(Gln) amidotransferase subunit D
MATTEHLPSQAEINGPAGGQVATLHITPNLGGAPELLANMFRAVEDSGSKALIIQGFATGTVPVVAHPHIERLVKEKNIPVFVLSDNKGEDFGVRNLKYENHEQLVTAGAIPLRDVNVNDTERVVARINESLMVGANSNEIVRDVIGEFGIPDNYEEWVAKAAQQNQQPGI